MRIRKAELKDLAQIVQIEGLCFPEETAFPPGMFAYLIRYAVALVACEPEEKVLGFVMGYTSGNAGAVYTLDVHTGYRRKGIENLAHGCTGRGNDQLRFEAIFRATDCRVIAPMRELDLAREWEIDYAREHGIEVTVTKDKPWSIDENIWSRSIEGGKLEDPYFEPPEEIYGWTKMPDASRSAQVVEIGFEKGIPVSLDGVQMDGLGLIEKLNQMGGEQGVGRTDMVEDRVLGLKARENYEHPAATILLTAHKDLERLVLSRNELRFKVMVDEFWSELAYMGLVEDPLYADLNAFVDQSQKTGERLRQDEALLRKRHAHRPPIA